MRSLPTLARRAAALFAVCAFLVPLVVFASTQGGRDDRIVLDVETGPYSFLSFDPIDDIYLIAPDGQRIEPSSNRYSDYLFTDLEHDEYELRIEDPRFQRLERKGLKPGKSALAWVRPNSGLVLEVVDGTTGEAVERYGVSVRLVDAEWRPNDYDVQSRRRRPPADHFHPIPQAHRFALIVDSKQHGPIEIPQDALVAGERRELRVELHAAVTVRGRVVQHDGATPVGGGRVMLRRPGDPITNYEPRTHSTPPQVPPLLFTDVGEDGAFSFECAPGTYALHVVQDEWLDASHDPVSIGVEGADGLLVTLPPTWTMRGRVTGGDRNAIRGAVVRAYPRSPYKHLIMADRPPLRVARVQDDGSFVVGLLPEGEVLFQLQAWPTHDESGRTAFPPPPELDLGTQFGGPGATLSHEFAVSEWPTTLDVDVTVNGEPPRGAHLSLQGSGGGAGMRDAKLDDGRGSLSFVMPGSYGVRVRFHSNVGRERIPLDVTMPVDLVVRTGVPATLECRITTSTGRVRVVDEESGDPLVGERVCLWYAGDQYYVDTTDDDGRLEMTLPAGRFRIEVEDRRRRRPHEPADWTAVVTWTDDGPADSTLRMHRGER